jgi:spore coat polysaccharide biosynthesis protein SpsF (cytidylyltransferase family)
MVEKKITVMIQVRSGSTRLPKKALKKIEGKPIIWHMINRVKKIKSVEQIILITTQKKEDRIFLKIAKENGILAFQGSEHDVLDRHYQCAIQYDADPILRITSDCPLIDPLLVEKMLQIFLKNNYDYVTNREPPTFPDGLDTEIIAFSALKKTTKYAKMSSEREHVTSYITKNSNKFKIFNYRNKKDLSHLRWTVDEKRDLDFVKKIYFQMKPKTLFSTNTVLKILAKEPSLLRINQGIIRNEGHAKSLKNGR